VRRVLRRLHLIGGLASGLILFIVSITGCVFCFEKQGREWMYSDLLYVPVSQQASLTADSLVSLAATAYPSEKVRGMRIQGAGRSVEVLFKGKLSVYVDPASGRILGSARLDEDFFGRIEKVHRTLNLGETGKIITGCNALVFLVLILTGIVIWWPKRNRFRVSRFRVKWNAHKPRLLYDLHSVLGFYASWIMIFTVLTGLIFAFKWAEKTMFFITGSEKQEVRVQSADNSASRPGRLQFILEQAYIHAAGAEMHTLILPDEKAGAVRVTSRYETPGILVKQDHAWFDRYSGRLLKSHTSDDQSRGEVLRASNFDIHTGRALGLPGQFLVFFAGFITASLPVTGFLLWLARQRSRREHAPAAAQG
jgi:uncharacterized iron-regulated membrane protein